VIGPVLLVALAVGNPVLWVVARPADLPTTRYVGEFFGVEAVLLLSLSLSLGLSLVLTTLLTPIEHAFGGLAPGASSS